MTGDPMKQITVSKNEAGQRLDKLLAKFLREAPKSFLYKMMRKKNITLNGQKAQGSELLKPGDEIRLFLAEDTIRKFQGMETGDAQTRSEGLMCKARVSERQQRKDGDSGEVLDIVYEDEDIILINKPAGMLSQKASRDDVSLVELLIDYLLCSKALTEEQLQLFRPSVCNRLDRNTSGLVIAGKSLAGLQQMSEMLRSRTFGKYYRCIVNGVMSGEQHLSGYLSKDEKTNRVTVTQKPGKDAKPIETSYRVLKSNGRLTLLEVHLITGRSHQIRAHLASIGHPIIGDGKYGNAQINKQYRRSDEISCQLLHAYRLEFPRIEGALSQLSGRVFIAPLPPVYEKLMKDVPSQNAVHQKDRSVSAGQGTEREKKGRNVQRKRGR